jgi:hypothetical protein
VEGYRGFQWSDIAVSSVLQADQSYTFSKIFDLRIEADELAGYFGYTFQRKRLNLPQYQGAIARLEELRSRIEAVIPYVSLTNETARREVLISQVVLEVVQQTKSQLRIEYPIKVTEQLQGYLDYLLQSQSEILVIEAKREDMDYGFSQLVAEMIALDQWDRTPAQPKLIGVVTTGQIWRFGLLDRQQKLIQQGLDLYRVPDDLEAVLRILIQALF